MPIFRAQALAGLVAVCAVLSVGGESRGEPRPGAVRNDQASPREAAPARPVPAQSANRPIQVAAHGRYPAGQVHGGYRNPFTYPYYRYGPRHYPFGNGPYGPYGSNYGGYSGNAYNPRLHGSPPLAPRGPGGSPTGIAPPAPDDPDAPDPPDAPQATILRPRVAAPGVPTPPALAQPVPGMPPQPVPNANHGYGDPAQYMGGPMYNPTYGSARSFGTHPYGFTSNEMWYGHNGRVHGFGAYPALNYPYSYGPPSGAGFYSAEYAPEYYNDPPRNFGPTYPAIGGINGGEGW